MRQLQRVDTAHGVWMSGWLERRVHFDGHANRILGSNRLVDAWLAASAYLSIQPMTAQISCQILRINRCNLECNLRQMRLVRACPENDRVVIDRGAQVDST